ncbi:hypothetical protein G7076_08385 [Sphingomonas sp. HDW15A]|uniref:hypothetical protein n=1 Tax=Sphingomonas sp. HDW15A TaxID=2714942 RepID=UPI00140E8EF7|nr:hypothetical protein [Sphingomonas sp. HDW15A]QIK96456.1 hypothetical protein G7076_08385 [Sphingomonas sp. HDW15A]
MTRFPIFLASIAASTLTITATVDAASSTEFNFRLKDEGGDGANIRADFRRSDRANSQWNSSFRITDFAGLERSQLAGKGQTPVRFALVRDAGRLDCSGTGGSSSAEGQCRFTANQEFLDHLRSSGIAPVSGEDVYAMTAVGVRRDLITEIRRANYPAPSAQNLIALAALGLESGYIQELAASGYRPAQLNTLIQFKALGVDGAYIESLKKVGYGNLALEGLVEFKALGITADYIRRLQDSGIRVVDSGKLVQMKALGVGPADNRPNPRNTR